MLSENRVRELAIRWYFLAILAKRETEKRSAPIFSKAHSFIRVLDFPSSLSRGKKSEEGLKKYAEYLLNKWLEFDADSKSEDDSLSVNEWLGKNVNIDFENHI